MSKIVLIGGGGHCHSVLDSLLRANSYDDIVITDAKLAVGTTILNCPVVGNDEILPDLFQKGYHNAFITIGSLTDTTLRQKLFKLASEIGYTFPNIIDPSSIVSPYANLSEGIFIGKRVSINANASINKQSIINTSAIIEHDCTIGSFCHVSINAVLCGDVLIGDNVFIGAGTNIIQGCSIGSNTIIGAGSLILSDVAPNSKIVGTHK